MGKARSVRAGQGRGTTWQKVVADTLRWPGVLLGTSYRTPALFIRKRLIARLREDGETVVVGIDFLDRDVLLEADPEVFYLTDHYRPYPWVLMRLSRVRHANAMELLEQAWRRAAPQGLVQAKPAQQSEPGATTARKR